MSNEADIQQNMRVRYGIRHGTIKKVRCSFAKGIYAAVLFDDETYPAFVLRADLERSEAGK